MRAHRLAGGLLGNARGARCPGWPGGRPSARGRPWRDSPAWPGRAVARTIVSMERSYVTAAFFRHRTYERYRAQLQQQTAARLLGEGGRPLGPAAFCRGCGSAARAPRRAAL